MINYNQEPWDEIEALLDALEIDYTITFKGNLILRFSDFDIVEEETKEVVDHVDNMFLEFRFTSSKDSYTVEFYRTDYYLSLRKYVHPHVSGSNHCTGDYSTRLNLLSDIVYYHSYVRRCNKSGLWISVPDGNELTNQEKLQDYLIPTFVMDVTVGYPIARSVEFTGDLKEFVATEKLSDYHWKGERLIRFPKTPDLRKINFKSYFNHAKFYRGYIESTSSDAGIDIVQNTPF